MNIKNIEEYIKNNLDYDLYYNFKSYNKEVYNKITEENLKINIDILNLKSNNKKLKIILDLLKKY